MSKIKYNISLDMHSSVSQASVAAKQGDDNRQFAITLRSGSQPYKIERGAFAVFSTTLPDGKTVIEDNCIIVDDEIIYDFTKNLTSQEGVLDIEIRLYGPDGRLITSPSFILVVSPRAAKAENITSSNSFTALDTMYKEANEAAQRASDAAKFATDTALSLEEARDNGEFNGEDGEDGEDVNYNLVANALKGSASGEVVTLTDVSPVEHEMKVKARSENLFDCANAQVFRYIHTSLVSRAKNSIVVRGESTRDYQFVSFYLPDGLEGKTLTICGDWVASGSNKGCLRVEWCGSDGTVFGTTIVLVQQSGKSASFKVPKKPEGAEYLVLLVYSNLDGTTEVGDTVEYTNIQIEIGTEATPYKPFVDVATAKVIVNDTDTYPINADGTVDGVTSIYPTTTLVVDTEGVTLDVEYNRDINKAIAELLNTSGIPRISHIDLLANKWEGSDGDYTQVVSVKGVTKNSYIEFGFSHEQLKLFAVKDVSFSITNENGVVIVGCVGQKPTADYRLQIKITEVLIDE